MEHIPVLLDEVIQYLAPEPHKNFVDATFGRGGHAREIWKRIQPAGQLFVLDQDPKALESVAEISSDIHAINGNFSQIEPLVRHVAPDLQIHGVLIDCGISSAQLRDSSLGLSFQEDGPLDMRLNRESGLTAADIINHWTAPRLAEALREFGEERSADRIAKAVVTAREVSPIRTTLELARVIGDTIPRRGKIHPATKTFQALRIVVNDEFENLRRGIQSALRLLTPTGRLAIITFHSLEDRVAKYALKDASTEMFRILTKHVVKSKRSEVVANPRARSAKLRVIERVSLSAV